jgi:hypothetical protein
VENSSSRLVGFWGVMEGEGRLSAVAKAERFQDGQEQQGKVIISRRSMTGSWGLSNARAVENSHIR